jgi:hypothetical protein
MNAYKISGWIPVPADAAEAPAIRLGYPDAIHRWIDKQANPHRHPDRAPTIHVDPFPTLTRIAHTAHAIRQRIADVYDVARNGPPERDNW